MVRITTHRATPSTRAFVGHLERRSGPPERHFRAARQIVQHPPGNAFNIVGSPFTIRRKPRSTCVGIRTWALTTRSRLRSFDHSTSVRRPARFPCTGRSAGTGYCGDRGRGIQRAAAGIADRSSGGNHSDARAALRPWNARFGQSAALDDLPAGWGGTRAVAVW